MADAVAEGFDGARVVGAGMTNTPDKIVYTARAHVTGGRAGSREVGGRRSSTSTLTAPKATGGPGTGTNPEQLFAVGYGACFQGALGLVAKTHGVDASQSIVEAAVGFGPEGDSFAITVDIVATIPGVDDAPGAGSSSRPPTRCARTPRPPAATSPVTVKGIGA